MPNKLGAYRKDDIFKMFVDSILLLPSNESEDGKIVGHTRTSEILVLALAFIGHFLLGSL